jgi:outer membrane receptor protein involved in Fe transport
MPDGAGFYNRSRLFHLEGQYNFKKQIKVFDLTVGANWRMYDMRSNGSTYNDSGDNPIHMHEYAVFVQVFKNLFRNHLKLLLSLRYDKNQNFTGQFSPRASAVYTFLQNHNIRVSYQTGLLNPPVVSLYIDMDVVSARAVGTTQEFHDKYRLSDWTYTIQSVDAFSESVANSDPDPSLLVPYTGWEPLKPERVQVLEIGYRGLFGNRLFLDAYYYYNIYHNFQSNVRVRQAQDAEGNPSDPFSNDEVLFGLLGGGAYNTFSWLGNNTEIVRSNGAALGIDYNFYKSYRAGINYTWNKMIDVGDDQLFLDQYNTPEHIVNISFSNMYLTRNLGFAIAWRWQDAFAWDVGIYQNYKVPAFGTLDAQVNYRIPKAKLTLRLGGTNILNERYVTFTGGPTVGAVYYFQLTFDQLMK